MQDSNIAICEPLRGQKRLVLAALIQLQGGDWLAVSAKSPEAGGGGYLTVQRLQLASCPLQVGHSLIY